MVDEYIEKIIVNQNGTLSIQPKGRSFDMIYRSAMGVDWDAKELCLTHNPSEDWNAFLWYLQILDAVKSEYGVVLKLSPETSFVNIDDDTISRIKSSQINKVPELITGLFDKNDKAAYKCLQELEKTSLLNNSVYQFFETFADMLNSNNSYIRTRGLLLISANAKWDEDNKIDEIIDKYLEHIADEKPITARQCIKALPNIAKYKPDLTDVISTALKNANPGLYADSMHSLISSDIRKALQSIRDM